MTVPTIPGEPASCRATAGGLRRLAAAHREAVRELEATVQAILQWTGRAAAAAEARRGRLADSLAEAARRIDGLSAALETFADDIEEAQQLVALAAEATATPVPGPCAPDPVELAALARDRERAAHDCLLAAIAAVPGDGLLEDLGEGLGFLPPDHPDRIALAAWGQGLGSLGAQTAAAYHLERLAPLDPPYGRHTDLVARAEQLALRVESRAHVVQRVTGPVGHAVTVATVARGQWQTDADDPALGAADRVGRVGVRTVLDGGATIAGGIYGGQVGASIGTAILPGVGTVVGGVAGGLIGSFVASKAGGALADRLVEGVDDVIDLGAEAADAVAEAGTEVGEAVGDVVDDLCFWD